MKARVTLEAGEHQAPRLTKSVIMQIRGSFSNGKAVGVGSDEAFQLRFSNPYLGGPLQNFFEKKKKPSE